MSEHLAVFNALLILVAPLFYLSLRQGWTDRRWFRWALSGFSLAVLIYFFPSEGVDFLTLKKAKMVLALAALFLLSQTQLKRPSRLLGLTALLVVAFVNYYNYFDFHGQRTWVHLHDVAHYYLGSKYYDELAHDQLYTALVRAESEDSGGFLSVTEARQLRTYDLVPVQQLLEDSPAVKGQFTEARWRDFKNDSRVFRERLGPHWPQVLRDHGFNPTPFWTLIGGWLSNRVAAESMIWLTLLDPLGLVVIGIAIYWAFGLESAILGLLYFFVAFGSGFGWTGGAFLRYGWLTLLVLSLACLSREKGLWSGIFLALAAGLRVFPALFALGLAGQCLSHWVRRKPIPSLHLRFFTGFVAAGLFCLLATHWTPGGLDSWRLFRKNTQQQVRNLAPNQVGLTKVLAYRSGNRLVTSEEFNAIKDRRNRVYRYQLIFLGLPLLGLLLWKSNRMSAKETYVLAFPALFLLLNLAAYYWIFLIVGIVFVRDFPRIQQLLFALEGFTGLSLLFENRDGFVFLHRNLYVALFLILLFLALRGDRSPREMTLST